MVIIGGEVGDVVAGEGAHFAQGAGEHAGFDAGNAFQAPVGVGDLLDEQHFEGAGRAEVVFEIGVQLEEGGGVLVRENGVSGEETVLDGIAAGGGFAFESFGAGAMESIAAVGVFFGIAWT